MERQSVRVDRIGAEQQPVVVVENFAADPDALGAEAAALPFRPMGEFYPGLRAPAAPGYCRDMAPLLTSIVREVFGARDQMVFNRALWSIAATPPGELSLAQRIPHIDGVTEGMIAIVHYLARDDFGGTSFYRHRSTGFETVNESRHRRYLDALKRDFATHGEPPPAYIEGDTPLFERTAQYDPVFNRAIIYRSSLLHCADLPNGTALPPDPRTGRLTIASFLTAT